MSRVRPVALAEGAVEGRCPVVAREDVDQARAVRAVRQLREKGEKAEDLAATVVGPGHHAGAGHMPDGVLGEAVAQRESLLELEGPEDLPDERLVPLVAQRPSSQRSIRPATWCRCASVNSIRASSRRASTGSSFATAASSRSRHGVGSRSCRRSHRRRLTLA